MKIWKINQTFSRLFVISNLIEIDNLANQMSTMSSSS